MTASPAFAVAAGGALAAAGAALLGTAALRWRRAWQLRRTPPSRIRSAATGQTVLLGRATPVDRARAAPVSGVAAVWYRSSTGTGWIHGPWMGGDFTPPFYLEDDTGRVLVVPDGATVLVPARSTLMEDGTRVAEWSLPAGEEVLVAGELQPLRDRAGERRGRIAGLLHGWLKDPAARAALDTNRDGVIQNDEWDRAYAKASGEVLSAEAGEETGAEEETRALVKPRLGALLICPVARLPAAAGGPLGAAGTIAGALLLAAGVHALWGRSAAAYLAATRGAALGLAGAWVARRLAASFRIAAREASEMEQALAALFVIVAAAFVWLSFLARVDF